MDKLLRKSSHNNGKLRLFKTDKTYQIRSRNVRAVKEALLIGPIAVTLNTKSNTFKYYKNGIINSNDCTSWWTNHLVVAVGYGVETRRNRTDGTMYTKPYIIIKNTWGKWWGEGGYARISLTQEHGKRGVCGILTSNFVATVKEVDDSIG